MEASDIALPRHIGQRCDIRCHRQRIAIDGFRRIDIEPNIIHTASDAARRCKTSYLAVEIALRVRRSSVSMIDVGQIQAADARLLQGQKLPGVGHSVAVEITPDTKAGKRAIFAVDDPVRVAVEFLERLEAVRCTRPVPQKGVVAEQFLA